MTAVTRLVTYVEVDAEPLDPRTLSVSARHEAELQSRRRVLLLDDRGWSESGPADVWAASSVDDVAATARVVVGPDEPYGGRSSEDMAADHWAALAEVLRGEGVEVSPAELRSLPHEVVLGERLLVRLGAGERGGGQT